MKIVFSVLLAGILLGGCFGAATSPIAVSPPSVAPTITSPSPNPINTITPLFTHIYAFGDEHSDNGNCLKAFEEAVAQGNLSSFDMDANFKGNWENRTTNGPVAVEVMAERIGVGLTDYAICAARSGHESIVNDIPAFYNTGLLGQIDKFEVELNGKQADPGALYFIEVGMDDFYATEDSVYANQVVANIGAAIYHLAKLGAKHYLVANSLDLSKVPGFYGDEAKIFSNNMNAILPGEIDKWAQELTTEIEIFDFAAIADHIQRYPDQYGLTNLTSTCTPHPYQSGGVCKKPDEYYYWGYFYLSRVVHQAMGETMAEQLSK